MPLDPVLQQLIAQFPSALVARPDYPTVRAQAAAMLPLLIGPEGLAEVLSVEEISCGGREAPVPMRIYRPVGAAIGTMHYIHGGGWSIGDLATVDHTARRLCRDLSMVIVTSTYRLAPEHPFPAAFEDSLLAAQWVSSHLAQLGGIARPAIIAGDSAGGNLAAAVCLEMRDGVHTGKRFDLQLLLYPAVDLRADGAKYVSRLRDADPTLRSAALTICVEDYAGSANLTDYRLSPIAAPSLQGLPPALVVVLEVDPLRDEALDYVDRLKAAGVFTRVLEFDNLTHGFVHMAGIVPGAAAAIDQVVAEMHAMLAVLNSGAAAHSGREGA